MKKVLLIICAIVLVCPMIKVNALPAIAITKTSYENGRISIEGTGAGEIQIVLFGLDNLPLYMTTTTAEDDAFSITLPEISGLSEGTYTIKVSDYHGTNVSTSTVEIPEEDDQQSEEGGPQPEEGSPQLEESNPKTFDNILLYIAMASICLVGIISSIVIYKKKEHN